MTEQFPDSVITLVQEYFAHLRIRFAASDDHIIAYSRDLNTYFEYLRSTGHDLERLEINEETVHGFEMHLRKCNTPEAISLQTIHTVILFALHLSTRQEMLSSQRDQYEYRRSSR